MVRPCDMSMNLSLQTATLGTPECCFDGGDCGLQNDICPSCKVGHYQNYVTNKRCDNLFNNLDCCFDGGLCEVDVCSTCADENLKLMISDGVCDSFLVQNPQCCNDGEDCQNDVGLIEKACITCQASGSFALLGTGQCDEVMNNHICCYDGGDCLSNLALICNDCDNPAIPMTAGRLYFVLKLPHINF